MVKLELIYKEDADGNWYQIKEDGHSIKIFPAKNLGIDNRVRAEKYIEDYAQSIREPKEVILKTIEV